MADKFFAVDGNPRHPPAILGYFAEKDDLNERLFFHWNPTGYTFDKEAEYESDLTHNDFIESLVFKGSKGLEVSFELFLNEVGQPRKIQRSVEASIGWLMNRMSPAQKGVKPSGSWLSAASRAAENHAKQTDPPPVLVLVGLHDIFTCVLTKVQVKSIFQRPNVLSSNRATRRAVQSAGADLNNAASDLRAAALARGQNLLPVPFGNGGNIFVGDAIRRPGDLTRATVQVTLKEYVAAPT